MDLFLSGELREFAISREYLKRISYVYVRWLTRYQLFLHKRN